MPEQIPNAANIEFKDKFVERYKQLTDFDRFKEYSLSFLRRSIRANTLKISVNDLKKRLEKNWSLEPIPWCREGFWIEHKGKGEEYRRDIGNLIEHQLGYFYVQEAASLIPPIVLNPKPSEIVLDMCAAPGSKATQLAMYMKNKGILIANDYKGDRIRSLGLNVQRCGLTNCIVTLMFGHWFKGAKKTLEFDRVLVDAPCSGTGAIRKSLKTLRIWNPNMVRRLAGQQRQLIEAGFNVLKKGGVLVYSTCTLEPEEDEGVVGYLLDKYVDAKIEFIGKDELKGLKRSNAVMGFEGKKYNDVVKNCLRIWPQDNDTEGFFVAKIRKL